MIARMKIILLFVIMSIVVVFSCKKEESEKPADKRLKVLVEFNYTNYAWAYTNHGWFIDSEGNKKAYDLPEHWCLPDKSGYIEYDSLMSNYNQADSLLCKINADTLMKVSAIIEHATNGTLSEMDCQGADIGSYSVYCYYWDNEKNMYKAQLLVLGGDCSQYNSSPEAEKILEYLNINIPHNF